MRSSIRLQSTAPAPTITCLLSTSTVEPERSIQDASDLSRASNPPSSFFTLLEARKALFKIAETLAGAGFHVDTIVIIDVIGRPANKTIPLGFHLRFRPQSQLPGLFAELLEWSFLHMA
jgi:hypothetical protein